MPLLQEVVPQINAPDAMVMAADDTDNMDSMPFDDDIPGDNFEVEFHECGTWSEDEEGNILPVGIL